MADILLITGRPDRLASFADSLTASVDVNLAVAEDGAAALERARSVSPQLAVIDSSLPDMAPLDLVMELLRVNAMINTVVVSGLSDEAFHEASEGLGVMGSLPDPPGPADGKKLLDQLRGLMNPG